MADEPIEGDASEAAITEFGPKFVNCPTCGNLRRVGEIIDDKCDSCRNANRPAGIVATLGWPEVRHRRMMLLEGSDRTQLMDRDSTVREAFAAWRQELRDITSLPTPFEAWARLDELQQNRPQE